MARVKVAKNISYDEDRKLYYVTFNYGKDSTGKTIKKYKTFERKTDANEALKKFNKSKAKEELIIPVDLNVKSYLDYWLNEVKFLKCEKTTLYGYKRIIENHINPFMGDMRLQAVTPETINKYFAMLSKEKSLTNNTIKKHSNLLYDVFNLAVTEDKLVTNPVSKAAKIKTTITKQAVYNTEQLKKLLDSVKDTRMEIVIMLAGELGLRREEIAGLRWCNVDFDKKEIRVTEARTQAGTDIINKDTKSNKSVRTLTIPPDVEVVLQRLKVEQEKNKKVFKDQYNPDGYIIAWEDGNPYRPNYLSDLFRKVIDDNKLPYVKLHGLRHSFASIANDNGVSIYDISKALGHAEVRITDKIYTEMFDTANSRAISTVSNAINKKTD